MNYINTIDLDNTDKAGLNKIVQKIKNKDCCASIQVKDSSSKGYHILMTCKIHCDLCRLVFDDQRRYELDTVRPEKFRNTLFSEKEYFGKRKVSHLCDRCLKVKENTQLKEYELPYEEFKDLIATGKLVIPPLPFIFGKKRKDLALMTVWMGYTCYKCTKCGWIKFVNNKKAYL